MVQVPRRRHGFRNATRGRFLLQHNSAAGHTGGSRRAPGRTLPQQSLRVSDPHIRFYAGAPLINEDGYALGTICVVDQAPRELTPEERDALKALSRLVLAQMEFRRNLILLKEALSDRTKEEHEREQELLKVQATLMRVLGLRSSASA